MNSCQLRQATVSDIPEMQRVITVAMAQYAKDSAIPTVLDALLETEENLREYVLRDYFLLAFRSDKLVGTLRISRLDETRAQTGNAVDRLVNDPVAVAVPASTTTSSTAYISRFAVLPSMQKLGVGDALFSKAEEYLKNNGYQRVILHTALTNAHLVRFYMKRKFERIETRTDRGYPRGTFVKEYH